MGAATAAFQRATVRQKISYSHTHTFLSRRSSASSLSSNRLLSHYNYSHLRRQGDGFGAPALGTATALFGTTTTMSTMSQNLLNKNLVSVQECLDAYNSNDCQNIKFVDASWYHKGGRNGRKEFEAGPRIPGAYHWDMDDIACSQELYPQCNPKGLQHMLPPLSLFETVLAKYLGVDSPNDQQPHVVIYAKHGTIFTPRTWFTFRSFGYEKVHLMQGSFEEWIELGGPIETTPTTVPHAKDLLAEQQHEQTSNDNNRATTTLYSEPTNIATLKDVLRILKDNKEEEDNNKRKALILDPRGSSFAKKGHMPGAVHIPYESLVDPKQPLRLLPQEEIKRRLMEAGVDFDQQDQQQHDILVTCGSGVSVCHVVLALEECGWATTTKKAKQESSAGVWMYDGSWNEYGSDPKPPKVLPETSS